MKLGSYDPPWLTLVAFKFHPPEPPSGRTVNEKLHFSLGSREMLLLLQFLIQFSDILV